MAILYDVKKYNDKTQLIREKNSFFSFQSRFEDLSVVVPLVQVQTLQKLLPRLRRSSSRLVD